MGVHGLWELLAPVGRRVSVETLAGKKLAIDASIWMIQFMKAMRDEKGEMVKNAHILGFFRRICKLLFLRTKPVFVFDGGTPALKRRTVIARRRQRENAQAKIRKTAEKLLLNHLKAMKLKELADNLESQRQNKDAKGKKILVEEAATAEDMPESDDPGLKSYNQEKLDEMLAASLAAEADGVFGTASTSGGGRPYSEEDDSDEDEEMILPAMHGKIDPAALASLPPSMQLDLLGQMRERLMADNRQRYQKVKKVPAKFSELQIQAYLKTVAFRREINEVQKSAAGRGVGGAQVSRIASEANREFIFSSSFTGDKQALTSAGVEENGDKHQTATEHPSSNSLGSIACTAKANTAAGSGMVDEPRSSSVDGVETYLDERGHVRVSRVRAMGIRMTRDLQRNLELMKEIEKERMNANDNVHAEPSFDEENYGLMRNGNQCVDDIGEGDEETVNMNSRVNTLIQDDNDSEQSMSKNGISIEISFEQDTEHKCVDGDDGDIFARLVAEAPVGIPSVDCNPSEKLSSGSASDCDWEEGTVAENRSNFKAEDLVINFNADTKSPLAEINSDESDVEWEEGGCGAQDNASPCQDDCGVVISKGNLEEESNIQEAIKRSLEDLNNQRSFHQLSENHNLNFPLLNVQHQNGFEVAEVEKPMPEEGLKTVRDTGNSEGRLTSPVAVDHDKQMDGLTDKPYGRCNLSDSKHTRQDAIVNDNLTGEVQCRESVLSVKPMELPLTDQLADTSRMGDQVSSFCENCFGASSSISNPSLGDSADVFLVDAAPSCHPDEMVSVSVAQGVSSVKKAKTDINNEIKMVEEINDDSSTKERENDLVERANWENRNIQVDISAATLEEEMLILDQERTDLGDEQRKLERNAESVSSEMFAECQELLQMFGLPYIIAPMEAEAQCAYMELTNLVDGVVTDDSDVFLFGAQSVYKNIFDDRKYVETYFMKDIESELGLTREKIIRMALLLGSDYTEGVSGIGIVNAIEVVNAFPEEHGLRKFREWIESPDPTILGKVNRQTSSRKRESNVSDSSGRGSNSKTGASSIEESVSEVQHSQSDDDMQNMKQTFMDQHRNISKNWHIPSSFPSEAVISAYVSPKVDKSTDPFSWGKPDLLILRKICWEKFGWGNQKADELLLPVLKEYNKHETQLRLEAFYTFNERFAKIRSRRINKAVKGITEKQSLELVDDDASQDCRSRKKKRGGATKSGNLSENFLDGIGDNVAQGNGKSSGKKITKPPRKRSTQGDPLTSKLRNPESPLQAEGSRGSSGSGRGRGRGRRQGTGRGKRQKMSPSSDVTENGSDDGSDCSIDQRQQVQDSVESSEVRRSKRPQKLVKYNLNDLNIDDVDKSFDHEGHSQSIGESNNEKAMEQEPSGSQSISEDAAAPASVQSERNQHGVGHPPLDMGSHHNYFKAGGGIKVSGGEAEKETVLAALSENVDPSFNADTSKDYLEIGGGFCMEEDENEDEPVECASNPPGDTTCQNGVRIGMDGIKHDTYPHELGSTLTMAAGVVQGREETDSSFHDGVQRLDGISSSDCSIVAKPLQENVEKDANAGAGKPFSAMPLLRRKRRKS